MGAALGLLFGGALGYAGARAQAQAQQQRQSQQNMANLIIQQVPNDPGILDLPATQKALEPAIGKGGIEILRASAQHHQMLQQAGQQGLQGLLGGGGQPQAGAAPQAGAQPAGAPAQAGGGTPALSPVDELRQKVEHGYKFMASPEYAGLDPTHQKVAQDLVKSWEEQARQLQAQTQQRQEFDISQAGLAESRKATEASRQVSEAIAAQSAASMDQFRQFQEQHAKEEDATKRQTLLDNMQKNIDTSREKLLAGFSKLQDAQKPAAEAQVKSYNTMASTFYRKHSDAGAPTLLKFNPEVKGTGLRGIAGGTPYQAPTIEAVPPQYGTNKKTGESGWLDADGNFYPDASSK